MARAQHPESIHQLKVTLRDIRPPIWRRIQVASDTRLSQLRRILQLVMGWENDHLYQFSVGRTSYGEPDREYGLEMRSARTTKVTSVRPPAPSAPAASESRDVPRSEGIESKPHECTIRLPDSSAASW